MSRIALPSNYVGNSDLTNITLFDFSNVADWAKPITAPGGAAEQSTLHNTIGTGSIKLYSGVTTANGQYVGLSQYNRADDLSQATTFGIKVGYNQDSTPELRNTYSQITVILGNDNAFAAYFAATINTEWQKQTDGMIVLKRSDFSVVGAADWNAPFNLVNFRHTVTALGVGNTLEAYLDAFVLNPRSKPKVILSFDDNTNTQYTEAYLGTNLPSGRGMQARNMPGSLFINASTLDTGNSFSTAELATMAADGWSVSNHTWDHIDASTATETDFEASVVRNMEYLAANQYDTEHFSYPYGSINTWVFELLARNNFKTARLTRLGDKYPGGTIYGLISTSHGILDPYRLTTDAMSNGVTTAASVLTSVARAIAVGCTCHIYGHGFVATPSVSTQWALTELDDLLDGLETYRDLGLIDIVNHVNWYRGLEIPRVPITRAIV